MTKINRNPYESMFQQRTKWFISKIEKKWRRSYRMKHQWSLDKVFISLTSIKRKIRMRNEESERKRKNHWSSDVRFDHWLFKSLCIETKTNWQIIEWKSLWLKWFSWSKTNQMLRTNMKIAKKKENERWLNRRDENSHFFFNKNIRTNKSKKEHFIWRNEANNGDLDKSSNY